MTRPGANPFRPPSTATLPGSAAFRPSGSSVGGGPIGLGSAYEDPNPTLSAKVDALYTAAGFWDWLTTRWNVQSVMADYVDPLLKARGYDYGDGAGKAKSHFSKPFSGILVELRCKVVKTDEPAQFTVKELEPIREIHLAEDGELTGFEPAGNTAEMSGTTLLQSKLAAAQAEEWMYTFEPKLCHRYWFLLTMETLVKSPTSIDGWRRLASQTRDLSGPSVLEKTWGWVKSLLK